MEVSALVIAAGSGGAIPFSVGRDSVQAVIAVDPALAPVAARANTAVLTSQCWRSIAQATTIGSW